MVDFEFSPYEYDPEMYVVIKVTPSTDAPDTGDAVNDPLPWIAAIILSITVIATVVMNDRKKYAAK